MFGYYGNIHVYCPGVGAHEPLGSFFFRIGNIIFSPVAHFLQVLSFKCHFNSFPPFKCIGDLSWPCRKMGEGHHRVMMYIYIVSMFILLFQPKFYFSCSRIFQLSSILPSSQIVNAGPAVGFSRVLAVLTINTQFHIQSKTD